MTSNVYRRYAYIIRTSVCSATAETSRFSAIFRYCGLPRQLGEMYVYVRLTSLVIHVACWAARPVSMLLCRFLGAIPQPAGQLFNGLTLRAAFTLIRVPGRSLYVRNDVKIWSIIVGNATRIKDCFHYGCALRCVAWRCVASDSH